tara:strand:- start:122 stop:541 length:420 start_codon:yes stop_codon:yes gene_type:complete
MSDNWEIINDNKDIEIIKGVLKKLIKENKLLMEKLNDIETTNNKIVDILQENRHLYLKQFNEVVDKEEKNYNEIKPYIKNSLNINSPMIIDRLSNVYMRNPYLTTPNLSLTKILNDNNSNNKKNLKKNLNSDVNIEHVD